MQKTLSTFFNKPLTSEEKELLESKELEEFWKVIS
jgi:hypothetical protein